MILTHEKAYWISGLRDRTGGFVPSLVMRDQVGHTPLTGDGSPHSRAWTWGDDIATARKLTAEANQKQFGLSMAEADQIVLSAVRDLLTARDGQNYVWRLEILSGDGGTMASVHLESCEDLDNPVGPAVDFVDSYFYRAPTLAEVIRQHEELTGEGMPPHLSCDCGRSDFGTLPPI